MTLLRFGVPAAALLIIGGLYVGMHPLSLRLLSPPPGGFVAVTIVVVFSLALVAGYIFARDIPSRLVRRLVMISVMAFALYAGGVDARGLYSLAAFGKDVTSTSEPWMTIRGSGGDLLVTSLPRRKSLSLPATPEAIAAAGPGQCVDVMIDKAPSGAERLAASQKIIEAGDISAC